MSIANSSSLQKALGYSQQKTELPMKERQLC